MEDTNNLPDLSEFFSVLSKEKKESRQKLEEEIANPESGLSNLFQQLEEVHKETQKVSEEIPDNKSLPIRGLSPDDQNRLEAFSSLMNSVDVSLQEAQEETPEIIEPPIVVEVFNNNSEKETDKLEAFSKLFGELAEVEEKQEPQEELVITSEVSDAVSVLSGNLNIIPEDNEPTKPQIVAQETKDIITSVISNLSDMETKTEVKEEVDQITAIKTEFEKFKTHIQQHISNQGFSGGGSGETQLKFLDDVSITGQEDGDVLTYNSTTDKYELKRSGAATSSVGQLLEETDGDNIVLVATDSIGSDEGDDILLEIGVDGNRDVDQSILQELTSNIIPKHGGSIDLGSPTNRFRNIFLEANTIDLDGATIKSDGSGEISISADGAIFPAGSKDSDGKILLAATSISETSGVLSLQVPRTVPLFTQASGLTTSALDLTFSAIIKNRSVYTNSGHTFLLSNGSARLDASAELFEF